MKIGKHTVTGEGKYEELYINAKKYTNIFVLLFYLSLFGEIYLIVNYITDVWVQAGMSSGLFIRLFTIIWFPSLSWHKNTAEGSASTESAIKKSDIILKPGRYVLKPWLAIIETILCCSLLLSCVRGFIIYLVNSIYEVNVYNIVSLMTSIIGIIAYSGLLFYVWQYFRWYRWTWEELLLPPKERKARYKAKKLAERQKKREAREVKRAAARDRREAGGGVFFRSNERPAAKTVKSQTDRRAELENLKKLYDEGLIDEEEYKKAREKTLGI